MILIIGGAYQGKKEYAMNNYDIDERAVFGSDDINDIFTSAMIPDYHLLVKKMMADNIDPIDMTKRLCSENKEVILTMNEIGCGIVPMDKCEREWRENVGRCGCILAEKAEKVIRIICGIPTFLKE